MTAIINGIVAMLRDHWFWGAITVICLAWYSTITIYVAVRGAADLRSMLRRLSDKEDEPASPSDGSTSNSL